MMQQVIRMMGVSGRTVSWTRTETWMLQKFGFDESGKPKSFPAHRTIHGTLETKCPIMTREFCKDFSYILIYDDPDLKVAKDEYPDFRKIRSRLVVKRLARIITMNGQHV